VLSRRNLLHNRTVFNTCAAAGAKFHIDAARALSDLHFEISFRAFHGFQISVSDQFDIQMPADLDQLG